MSKFTLEKLKELKDRVENVVATPQDVDRTDENQDLVFKLSILRKTYEICFYSKKKLKRISPL